MPNVWDAEGQRQAVTVTVTVTVDGLKIYDSQFSDPPKITQCDNDNKVTLITYYLHLHFTALHFTLHYE